jgi:hypothetical protein
MFLTKYMSAPRVKGVFVVRGRRPYPMVSRFQFPLLRILHCSPDPGRCDCVLHCFSQPLRKR